MSAIALARQIRRVPPVRTLRYIAPILSRHLHHAVRCHANGKSYSRISPSLVHERLGIGYRYPRALMCTSTEETKQVVQNAPLQKATGRDLVLSPPALVVTREYEWANILVGFEQANKYTIRSAPGGEVVGFLAEESSIGRTLTRNFLRTHRPFKATVFDKDNNVVFIMRRPMYLISTSIFVETPEGEVLGEVHMNWHMWRRRYQLYAEKAQFAVVDSGFLAVDFDMRDMDGRKMASVNKDFTGFARELFTDARQYVLRMDPSFGLQHDGLLVNDAATINTDPEEYSHMKLDHRERAVILATAIAIDFDYFSLHSRGSMLPAIMPMPPVGGAPPVPPAGAPGAAGGAGAVAGADVLSDAMNENSESGSNPFAVSEEEINAADQSQQFEDGPSSDFDSSSEGDFQTPPDANETEWATFEEPDHGFDDSFKDDGAWSGDSDDWSSDAVTDDGGGGGLFGLIKSIFFDDN